MKSIFEFFRNLLYNMIQLFSYGPRAIKNKKNIFVKTNNGRTIAVNLEPNWDIKDVKEVVAPKLGMVPSEVKIIFAGKELSDNTILKDCDLGEQSILHAIRARPERNRLQSTVVEEEGTLEEPSHPLHQTLVDLQLIKDEYENVDQEDRERTKAHFYVYCTQCQNMCKGKLRVRCSLCKGGAFTVHQDPECWDDVLRSQRIRGHCESTEIACVDNESGDPPFAEFYFKCAEHVSGGEKDYAVPLNLIKINMKLVPCLACFEQYELVLVFPCKDKHVTCISCFKAYCLSRLMDRQYISHPDIGYTLPCPAGCEKSLIEEIHHFKLLPREEYDRYQRFATEEFVLQAGGVLCPRPDCGMGLLIDSDCRKVTCQSGCGFVFCRNCLQGYHIGDCLNEEEAHQYSSGSCEYTIDPSRAAEARWDEASNRTIKTSTKPCPKCRTPTEKDGGCMHMVCVRGGCGFEWCWICQTQWTHDCMGAHWFG